MTPCRGKRVALLIAGLGVPVLLLGFVAFKDRAVEQYYLWCLESDDLEVQEAAADKLAQMGSVRAVPVMLKSCEAVPAMGVKILSGRREVLRTAQVPMWVVGRDTIESGEDPCLDAVRRLVGTVGFDAASQLEHALEDEDQDVRRRAAMLLGEVGAVFALPALEAARGDSRDEVFEYVIRRLEKSD